MTVNRPAYAELLSGMCVYFYIVIKMEASEAEW